MSVSRPLGVLFALTWLVCCGRAETRHASAQEPAGAPASVDQKVSALRAEFPDAKVQLDGSRSRVARIQGLAARVDAAGAEDLARSILRNRVVASALGLSTDLRELCQSVSRKDPQIADHAVVRMQQCVNGVKVLGAELVMSVRLKPSPAIDTLTSSLRADVPRSSVPKLTGAEASAAAAAALKARPPREPARTPSPDAAHPPAPELVVFVPALFQLEGPSRLCWLVRSASLVVLVDANDGSVVHQYSDVVRGASK